MKNKIIQHPKEVRRMSLKWKWALGTAIGVLLIFAVFSALIFQSFSGVLLDKEKKDVQNTLRTVTQQLSRENQELTVASTEQHLKPINSDPSPSKDENNLYSNAVIVNLSKENIAVGIYDLNQREVFASRNLNVPFIKKNEMTFTSQKIDGVNGYVARRAIYSSKTGKKIGYAQVANALENYHKISNKLILIFIVLIVTATFGSAMLGYVLASWLLRPIDVVNETIDIINEGDTPIGHVRVPDLHRNDELSDLTDLFNSMLDRMERYVDQQQQFVEDVSHELRTPVAIIQGHMELLNRWGKDDPAVLAESIEASLQEINRMKSLVQEMLDLSRAEQVEMTFKNELTDVRLVVLQIFNDFKMIHPDFTFILDEDFKGESLVKISRNHLEQVLIILMDNAVKYSETRKEIHISASKDLKMVQIAIQDFGEGISKHDLKNVFNRFYRVDKARSRDKGGNGLGLSIAQKLIMGYKGTLVVESVEKRGSIFRISLPLTAEKIIEDTKND